MREIKFRVWDKRHKFFVTEPKRFQLNKWGLSYFGGISEYHQKNSYILQEYTGLKDKNGNEIYEGDIMSQSIFTNFKRHDVRFERGYFCLYCLPLANYIKFSCEHVEAEVIGNIYENPELL